MTTDLPIKVGDPAPAFTLPDAEGTMRSLESLRGQWVVLYFYPKDDTSGWTTEAKEFEALLPQFEANNCVVFGISKDSVESHAKFKAKYALVVRLLSDENKDALNAYGAWREKNMYGKVSMGVVRSTVLIGPDGTIAHIWAKVAKGAGHAQKVLEQLNKISEKL